MSGFSNYLNGYMEESSITSAELSKELNIDRTTIYRYRKGRRIPLDEETVIHLAEGLRMSMPERKKLFEEYDRLMIGEFTVNSYFYVKDLMKKLKNKIEDPIPIKFPANGILQEKN